MRIIARVFALFAVVLWSLPAAALNINGVQSFQSAQILNTLTFLFPVSPSATSSITNNADGELLMSRPAASFGGRNVLALQNLDSTGYDALTVIDQNGIYRSAYGYGNSSSAGVFQNSVYLEASYFQYGVNPGVNAPPPIRFVSTGVLNGTYNNYDRLEIDGTGNIIFHNLNTSNDFIYDAINARLGFRKTPETGIDAFLASGAPAVFSDANASHSAYFGAGYYVNSIISTGATLQLAKTSVSRVGLSLAGTNNSSADRRVDFVDLDNSSVIPLSVALNGTKAVTAGLLQTTSNVGTPGTGTTAVEYGDGVVHTTVLTVNGVLPNIPGGASLGVGLLLYTLPAGAEVFNVSYMSIGITQTTGHINANTPNVGLGTVIASGAVSTLSGTPTFQNLIVGSNAANCTGTATVNTTIPTANVPLVTAAGGTKTVYFNAAAAWAASGDPAAVVAGTVVLQWQFLH